MYTYLGVVGGSVARSHDGKQATSSTDKQAQKKRPGFKGTVHTKRKIQTLSTHPHQWTVKFIVLNQLKHMRYNCSQYALELQ